MCERILIVSNDVGINQLIVDVLNREGYLPKVAENGFEAVSLPNHETFALIIADITNLGMDGLKVIDELKAANSDCEIVVICEDSADELAVRAVVEHGAYDVLKTPVRNQDAVSLCVKRTLSFRRLKIDNKALIRSLRRATVQLENRVEQRTALQAKLNEQLRNELKERKIIEAELRRSKEMAEVANRARSAFMSGMSHELRNPLNSVMGFCQVLQEKYFGPLTEKQEAYIRDIYESGKHLLNLINDILELVSIDGDNRPLASTPVNVQELIENSFNMIHHKSLIHRISVRCDISAELQNRVIRLDPKRFKQIMFNLLTNAVKFTPNGGKVTVSVGKAPEGILHHATESLKIIVSDTGIGIDKEDLEKIFDEFYQVKRGTIDKTPGAGLGLSIARKLVQQHGGKIWAESEGEGKGSSFVFVIPG
jgi:signal transduction histidine kinase